MRKILLVLVPLTVLAIALAGTHILVERLFILIMLVLLLSFLWALAGLWRIKGALPDFPQHSLAGQPLQVAAVIENHNLLPKLFLKLGVRTTPTKTEDTNPREGKIRYSKHAIPNKLKNLRSRLSNIRNNDASIVINIPGRKGYAWNCPLSFQQRGYYTVGPLTAESGDPFGLFHLKRTLGKAKEVLIYPAAVELPFFQAETGLFQNKLQIGDITGIISGVREYTSGDGLNRVHWRSSAHMDKLMVKEFEVDRTEKIWIIPDLSREFLFGTGPESIEESIITLAASLVKKYTDSGRSTGLIAKNQDYHFFPARLGYLNMWQIMDALAVMKADGQVPMVDVLKRGAEHLSGNSIAIVITASLNHGLTEAITSLRKRGIRGVLILLDSASFVAGATSSPELNGLQNVHTPVYIVRKGVNLAEALDSRKMNLSALSRPMEPDNV